MKKFIWISDDAFPRHGPKLEKDKEYSVEEYGEEIVKLWVEQGRAKYQKKEIKGGE